MATNDRPHRRGPRAVLLGAALALLLALPAASSPAPHADPELDADELGLVGFAGRVPDSTKPKITAYADRESYPSGGTARIVIADRAFNVTLQVYRSGGEAAWTSANDRMFGTPVSKVRKVGASTGRRLVDVPLGRWPSGVYFVRLAAGKRIGYAPFVLRPRRLGEHRVAIVIPTQTWQAYNFRDDDGNGSPDSWYDHGTTARLHRAFLDRGVPPHFKYYDARFLRWAYRTNREADYVSDAELRDVASGDRLRRAYRLLIFEGHHEYVTTHEYDVATRFRDLGGNLMFLSANNFYWRIRITDGVMTRDVHWREVGRPEASLIGVQFFHNDLGEHRGPWVVEPTARRLPWLPRSAKLSVGERLATGGIEADGVWSGSTPGVVVVARIRNLFGDGRDAEMSYYETPRGAKVFAAGAFSVGTSIGAPGVQTLVGALWTRLSQG